MANRDGEHMVLGTIVYTGGQHQAAWRHPDAQPDSGLSFEFYKTIAQTSERGKFDFMFSADQLCVRSLPRNMACRTPFTTFQFDPLTMLSALSAVTERLGFIVTMSSTYYSPYQIARHIAGLDLISGGRAGWNLVTSGLRDEALNHGLEAAPNHDARYEVAHETADVVRGFWKSTDPGVLIGDKETGILFDESKVHRFQYKGKFRSADGILSVPPSRQGRPIIVQAGASGPGRDLAAQIADVTFSISPDLETARAYRTDLRRRAEAAGRDPNSVKSLHNFVPVIAETEEAARQKLAELDALVDIDFALAHLEAALGGVDLTGYPLDGPLPEDVPLTNASRTLFDQARNAAAKEGLSIRQLAVKLVRGLTSVIACGSANQIADTMELWFREGAADGFLVSCNILPRELDEFVDQVVPILQARGLFRTEYTSDTLRGHLGLPVPGGVR
ncbi:MULTISPECIES: LLM class flavin-dependent oxidoreductase [unclassified Sphingobium]|uniref:LLM class flavin-dependent oxidoreductase n=1 Tax=unclassified Sphingobium TaxID=2611147 RepID=UPI0035A724B1